MQQAGQAVRSNCLYIAAVTLLLSALMQAVFLVSGLWDYTVLLGNLFGAAIAIGNFLLLALTVMRAVEKEEKDARQLLRASQAGRLFLQFLLALIGALVPVFSTVPMLLTLLFPRVALSLYPLIERRRKKNTEEGECSRE